MNKDEYYITEIVVAYRDIYTAAVFFLRATVLYRRFDISPRGCRALPVCCLSDSAAGRTTCVGGDLTKLRRYRQTERLDSEATMDADRGRSMDYRPVRQPVTTGSNRLSIFRRTEIRLDVQRL